MGARAWSAVALVLVFAGLAAWMRFDSNAVPEVEGLEVGGAGPESHWTGPELAGAKGPQVGRAATQKQREAARGVEGTEPGFGEYKRVAHTLNIKLVGPSDEPLSARIEVSPRILGTRAKPQTKRSSADAWTSFEFPDPVPVLIRVSEYPAALLPPVEAHDDRGVEGGDGVFTLDKALLPGSNSMVIRLCAGAAIEGLVVDETGAGMTGVMLSVHFRGQGVRQVLRAHTDEGGRYSIPCQPGPHRVVLEVGQGTGFPWQGSPAPVDIQLNPGQAATADFTMHRLGATVSGTVVDEEGQPYSRLRITALHRSSSVQGTEHGRRSERDVEIAQTTSSGMDGSFNLVGLQEGRIALHYGFWSFGDFRGGAAEEQAPPVLHDVGSTDHLDVGVVVVPRLKPTKVAGVVILEASEGGRSADPNLLELRASLDSLTPVGASLRLDNSPQGELIPLVQKAGRLTFEWTSSLPVTYVSLGLSGPGNQWVYRELSLQAGEENPVVLRFPPTED